MDEEGYPGVPPEPAPRRRDPTLAVVLVVLLAGGVAGWLYWRSLPVPPPPPAPTMAPPAPTPADAGIDAGPLRPPPVGDADTELHRAAAGLSSRPEWARWLAEPHLISRLVAATHRVAEGQSPSPVLPFLAPDHEYTAVSRGGQLFPAPAAVARYDVITEVATAIDPARVAAAYARLAPFFEAAYREIAPTGERFAPVLHQAIRELLATPVPPEEPALSKNGETFFYADERLEKLHPAQKQLLRLGVANARRIQLWLKGLYRALPN